MTTETMTNSGDWIQYYQHNISGEANVYGSRVSDSTVITTTFPSTSVPSPRGLGSDHLSPADGRVSKPIRKRSRASRRTPTTLLSTDTNNFRAMVQQYTGGPNQTLTSGFQGFPNGSQFSFEQGNHVQQAMNPATTVAPIPNRYPLQFQQQQQQQQELRTSYVHQLQQQVGNQTYVPANAFLQRLDDSRTNNINSNRL